MAPLLPSTSAGRPVGRSQVIWHLTELLFVGCACSSVLQHPACFLPRTRGLRTPAPYFSYASGGLAQNDQIRNVRYPFGQKPDPPERLPKRFCCSASFILPDATTLPHLAPPVRRPRRFARCARSCKLGELGMRPQHRELPNGDCKKTPISPLSSFLRFGDLPFAPHRIWNLRIGGWTIFFSPRARRRARRAVNTGVCCRRRDLYSFRRPQCAHSAL